MQYKNVNKTSLKKSEPFRIGVIDKRNFLEKSFLESKSS